ncbi:hypothetical protein BaRGS_00038569 [Batillaria attramentaria]|uniref:Uncharacterized protein n=1 Tax=Batillaria attramentaria TaxID=370345 RepID=A0ABD0J5A0_9CAEN
MTQASVCVKSMEEAVGRVIEGASGVTKKETLQTLCLDVIKGNNLTQCYLEATGGCAPQSAESPTSTMAAWERVMQDLYQMCDGACPNFLERTINITQCTSLIRFDELYDNSYTSFCKSLNASLQCSRDVSGECPLFSQLFYDLLPRGIDQTADTICTANCGNFDEALSQLEKCKSHVANLPDDLDAACSAYREFRTCLHSSDVPLTCPMFGALMDVLYPQHIFGLYEEQCNITGTEDTDACGTRGVARLDHCLRIFSLAWPASTDTPVLTQDQCSDFQSALRCLDNSGYNDCPNLQQYFAERMDSKQKHREILERGCADMNDGINAESSAAESGRRATLLSSLATLTLAAMTTKFKLSLS